MSDKIKSYLQLVAVFITLAGLIFAAYQALTISRVSLKTAQMNGFLKWQYSIQKLSCYYDHAMDKSVFLEELSDRYSNVQDTIEASRSELKQVLVNLDEFGVTNLNISMNEGMALTYKYNGTHYQDFMEIKKRLKDEELSSAIRNCEHRLNRLLGDW
jgi:hypothetical protein